MTTILKGNAGVVGLSKREHALVVGGLPCPFIYYVGFIERHIRAQRRTPEELRNRSLLLCQDERSFPVRLEGFLGLRLAARSGDVVAIKRIVELIAGPDDGMKRIWCRLLH